MMKLTHVQLRTLIDATPEDVEMAVAALGESAGPWREETMVQLDRHDPAGGFVRLSGAADRWNVEVASAGESTLHATRHPLPRGEAIAVLRRFLLKDPSLTIDGDWREVDGGSPRTRRWLTGALVLVLVVALRWMS